MTLTIRKEQIIYKAEEEKRIDENAYNWVEQNIILINEGINRAAIKRLTNAIQKFDQTFGPYKDKIPAIAAKIERAEDGLLKAVTGKIGDKSVSDMLQRMSYLYSTLSTFFSKDLPVLFQTPLFAAPKLDPEVKLNVLQPKEGIKYNSLAIRDAFKNALMPSDEEATLLRKIYTSKNIPLLDSTSIANQLLNLSYKELENITKMDKIPMTAIEEPVSPKTPEITGESYKTGAPLLREAMLYEVLNLEKMQKFNDDFDRLKSVVGPYGDRMPTVKKAIDTIDKRINDILIDPVTKKIKDKTKDVLTLGIRRLFNPSVEADMVNFYNMFYKFNQVWPDIRQRIGDRRPEDKSLNARIGQKGEAEAIEGIRKLLTKAVEKPLFSFKKPFISPAVFVKELMSLTPKELDIVSSGSKLQPPPPPQSAAASKEAQAAAVSQPAVTTKTATPTSAPIEQKTKETQPGTTQERKQSDAELENIAKDFVKNRIFTGENEKDATGKAQAFLNNLQKLGYTISK